jgi:hypothetical protein
VTHRRTTCCTGGLTAQVSPLSTFKYNHAVFLYVRYKDMNQSLSRHGFHVQKNKSSIIFGHSPNVWGLVEHTCSRVLLFQRYCVLLRRSVNPFCSELIGLVRGMISLSNLARRTISGTVRFSNQIKWLSVKERERIRGENAPQRMNTVVLECRLQYPVHMFEL